MSAPEPLEAVPRFSDKARSAKLALERAGSQLEQARSDWTRQRSALDAFLTGFIADRASALAALEVTMPQRLSHQMIPNPVSAEIKGFLADLIKKRISVLDRLQADHPIVQDLNMRIAELERQMRQTPELVPADDQASSLGSSASPAEPQIAQRTLNELIAADRRATAQYETLSASLRQADRALDTALSAALSAAQRYMDANSHIEQRASEQPVSGDETSWLWFSLACAASLVLVAGGIAAILIEAFNPRLRSASQLESLLGQPLIAVLPKSRQGAFPSR